MSSQVRQGKLGSYRILLVDDALELIECWKEILERRQFSVELATSACDGLEKTKKFFPDVIVSDYQMPNGNGAEFHESLQRAGLLPSHFIIWTANVDSYYACKPNILPALVLSKPVKSSQLIEVLEGIRTQSKNLSESQQGAHRVTGAGSQDSVEQEEDIETVLQRKVAKTIWFERRRHMRFSPNPTPETYVQFMNTPSDPDHGQTVRFPAVLVDFAPFGGAGIIIARHEKLIPGVCCRILVDSFEPFLAQVVRVVELDEARCRVGLRFLG